MANTTSATVEYRRATRKIKKHMVEKKRRLRMNSSLELMKTFVLEALGKDPAKYECMEKADILDITVSFLRQIRSTSPVTMATARVPHMTSSSRSPSPSGFSESFDSSLDGPVESWPHFDSPLTAHAPAGHVMFPDIRQQQVLPPRDLYHGFHQMAMQHTLPVTSSGYDVIHMPGTHRPQHPVSPASVWRPW